MGPGSRGGTSSRNALTISPVGADREAHRKLESEYRGYCGAPDTFPHETFKAVGRIYQQMFS